MIIRLGFDEPQHGVQASLVSRRSFIGGVGGAMSLAFSSGIAHGKGSFPSKPIMLLVPWSAGGGASTVADLVSKIGVKEKLSPVPIVLEHRPGANGLIGAAAVADRKQDGYTCMYGGGTLVVQVASKEAPVNPIKDLTPLAMSAQDSSLIVTRADAPYKTMSDVFDKLRAKPRSITIAGAGGGPSSWDGMLEAVMNNLAGVQFNQIPFNGGGEVQAAVLGGQVDVGTRNLSDAQELLKSGRMRALAVFDSERNSLLPDVPTMKELGLDVVLNLARGWFGPPGITQEEIDWYAEFFRRVGVSKTWGDFCTSMGLQNKYLGPAEWTHFFQAQTDIASEVYKRIGIR